jgi:hypothetical protein
MAQIPPAMSIFTARPAARLKAIRISKDSGQSHRTSTFAKAGATSE